MWADQVSASDDHVSLDERSSKKEVSSYDLDDIRTDEPEGELEAIGSTAETSALPSIDALVGAPTTDIPSTGKDDIYVGQDPSLVREEAQPTELAGTSSIILAPTPISPPVAAPLAFPSNDEPDSQAEAVIMQPERAATPQTPGVTFPANLTTPPSRTGTPDPESEPKRKRISSQNFQRLARRISLTTRRQSSASSILPNVLRRESPRVSVDDNSPRGEGSLRTESPAGSVKGDSDKSKLKKKEKKEKNRKSSL